MDTNFSMFPIQHEWKFSEEALKFLFTKDLKIPISKECYGELKRIEEIPPAKCKMYVDISTKNNVLYFSPMFALFNLKGRRVRGTFAFYIKSANYNSPYRCELFGGFNSSFGADVCSVEDFLNPEKKFIVNGECCIEMKGIFHLEASIKKSEPQQTLAQYLWNRDDQDFTIFVGKENESETEIKVHKCVLAARSSVFDAMLYTNMKEKAESKVAIIDFDVQTVKNAIAFCYDQNYGIPFNSITDATTLFQFADKYDIQDLKKQLEEYFETVAVPENICEIANAAVITNSSQLREFCIQKFLLFSKIGFPVDNIEILDKDFAYELLKATFSAKN